MTPSFPVLSSDLLKPGGAHLCLLARPRCSYVRALHRWASPPSLPPSFTFSPRCYLPLPRPFSGGSLRSGGWWVVRRRALGNAMQRSLSLSCLLGWTGLRFASLCFGTRGRKEERQRRKEGRKEIIEGSGRRRRRAPQSGLLLLLYVPFCLLFFFFFFFFPEAASDGVGLGLSFDLGLKEGTNREKRKRERDGQGR